MTGAGPAFVPDWPSLLPVTAAMPKAIRTISGRVTAVAVIAALR